MALPWQIPLKAALKNATKKVSSHQESLFKHFCNLNIHEDPTEELRTGIMCDIGVSNRDPVAIQRLLAAGMTVVRLDMTDLDIPAGEKVVQVLRQAVIHYSTELEYVHPIPVIMELRGAEIVTGILKGGVSATNDLLQYDTIRLTIDTAWRDCGTVDCLYISCDSLEEIHPRDVIFIDSLTPGKVKLIVVEVGDDSLECSIAIGGTIGSKAAVRITPANNENFRTSKGDIDTLSCSDVPVHSLESMEDQIAWAMNVDIDVLLRVNTECAQDIIAVKNILGEKGKHKLVFACIDSVVGYDNLDEILNEAEGIYVDRAILCDDLPVEKVFIAQKVILSKCHMLGKPCIFKAVINEQIPTICVTDIANLVLDGVDVIYLEFNYDSPLEKVSPTYHSFKMAEHCIAAAAIISRHAERTVWKPYAYGNTEIMKSNLDEPTKCMSISVAELAMRSCAVLIICLTHSGRTAKVIGHAVPHCPVLAITRTCQTARQLRFWRGVRSIHYFDEPKSSWAKEVEARVRFGLDYCKTKKMLRAGEPYILVTASRRQINYCDCVRLLIASGRHTNILDNLGV